MDTKENEKQLTGYPSIDKLWLKYYSKEKITAKISDESLYDYMVSCNKQHLDNVAINYFGNKITYRNFIDKINLCANALIKHEVNKGDIVSLCMLATPEVLILVYAINLIGAVSNFLILNSTEEEMRKQIIRTQSKIIFTSNLAFEKIESASKETVVEKIVNIPVSASMPTFMKAMVNLKQKINNKITWKKFLESGNNKEPIKSTGKGDDLAVIEYTSGTTGESKGVMLTNQSINYSVLNYKEDGVFEFKCGKKFLCIVPPFLAFGLITSMLVPLCIGIELILIPNPDPEETGKNIIKYKPNYFLGGPLHIENLVSNTQIAEMDLSFLEIVAYGGDKKSGQWENEISEFLIAHGVKNELMNGYGLTETGGCFCTTNCKTKLMIPFSHNNIKVCDIDNGNELQYGQEGEIYLSGPTLFKGYYKNSDETAGAILEKNGIRWFKTGDLGVINETGEIKITGRIKRVLWAADESNVIYRVYPMKIEEVINSLNTVEKCGVVGLYNDEKGYLPIAFVILRSKELNHKEVEKDIVDICKNNLSSVHQPYKIIFLDELPITRAGKVDFFKLEELAKKFKL